MNDKDYLQAFYKILLIEDDEEDVIILKEIAASMTDCQYEMEHCENLTQGLKRLKEAKFELVLLDLGLPECSGFETIDKISQFNKNTAIIVLTGLNDNDFAIRALEKGMEDYLVKGNIDPIILSRAIRYAVQRKKNILEIQQKEHYYRSLIAKLHEDIIVIDNDFTITDINNTYLQTTGLHRDEVLGKKCYEITHQQQKPCQSVEHPCKLKEVFETGKPGKCLHLHKNKHGSDRFVDIILSPLKDERGNVLHVIEAARDMTDYYNLNEQLKKSLKEKEILLSEVHHRVKNNMQIISSLLKMQAYNIQNEEALDCLQDSRNRVKSMSLIHDRLYQTKDFASVDLESYIRDLASYFYRSYSIDPNRVILKIEIENVNLSLNSAIPCGLVINELLSNSLKYAFPDNRKGIINIRVDQLEDNRYMLTFADDGVGMPNDFEPSKSEHLGLKLVSDLTQQLHGNIKKSDGKGVKYEILFKDNDLKGM